MERKEQLRRMLSKVNALVEAMRYSISSAPPNDIWKYSSYKGFIRTYNDLAKEATPFLALGSQIYYFDTDKVASHGNTIASQQKGYFDQAHSNALMLKSLLEGELGYAEDETHKLTAFLQGNLRKAVYGTPEKEVEVQNSIETLLVGRGMAKGSN